MYNNNKLVMKQKQNNCGWGGGVNTTCRTILRVITLKKLRTTAFKYFKFSSSVLQHCYIHLLFIVLNVSTTFVITLTLISHELTQIRPRK